MKTPQHRIDDVWEQMDAEKGDLITRSETFARWTVAAIMQPDGGENTEQIHGSVNKGARWVNHLANKIVDVLFPVSRPFFTIAMTPKAKLELEKEIGEENSGQMQEMVRDATSKISEAALRHLNLVEYRPVAIMAAKHLIVTGNVLLRRLPTGERVLYPVDRYGVRRDLKGKEFEVVLADKKRFDTFDDATKTLILEAQPRIKDNDMLDLYTHYIKEGKRWKITQEVEGIPVGKPMYQNEKDYDLLVLDWSLFAGENYGRGLVEDNATMFHQIDVCTEAVVDLASVTADIKFFVRPGSPLSLQIAELNAAPRGTYWPGNGEDITVPEVRARNDLQTLVQLVQQWEQELSQTFLMSSVRQAERVTAEEIRMVANELESAFGGLYSQLAMQWQQREADFAISKVDFNAEVGGLGDQFEVLVTTGLESLSKEGQIDNLRLAIGDLQMMEAVPEDVRGAMNALRFAKFVFTNRNVDLKAFLNTAEEMEANRQQALAEAGRLQEMQGAANVAEHAGKVAVDQQAQS